MKMKSVILMGCSQILALWLSGNILRVNAQDSAIKLASLPHFTQQISPPNSDTLTEQLMANGQESKIRKVPLQQLTQILPPNYAPLKDSWIILLIEVSAYGLLCEYAKKLLDPHPNEQKTNFMRVNAEDLL